MGELAYVIDEHPGVMNQGYDLHYRNFLGHYFRIRNLGGRRIRIESSNFRIADPCGLLLVIPCPPDLTVETGVESNDGGP